MRRQRFSREQIAEADQRDILGVARELNLKLEKRKNTYKVPGYGGLYITPMKNAFHCFSADMSRENNCGGGPIQLVMFIHQCTFIESVSYLLGIKGLDTYKREPVEEKEIEFSLPERSDSFRYIYAYLIKTRKIDRWVVDQFIKEKMLYENKYHSCVFVGYDYDGNPRHAAIRGTMTSKAFKGETRGSDKRFAFHRSGENKMLHVYESPIDMMSYLTLYPDAIKDHHVALCCLADTSLQEYLKHYDIQRIFLHLDNDEWGRNQTEKLKDFYGKSYDIWDESPFDGYKDFNEQLAGRKGWKMDDFLKGYNAKFLQHIHFTGFVDDEDLPTIFAGASWFVFPTKYEGFGIPPLESMACGTPVISSDAASMPEVLGNSAIYFENNSFDSLNQKVKIALSMSEIEKQKLIKRGLQQIKRFSWQNEAAKLNEIFKRT